MEIVTLSRKYQVVIPQSVRKALDIKPGDKLRVLSFGDRVEFVPVRPLSSMRGFLRGMDSMLEREDDR
jgi:AbrB family looped-hinge helix DNA binding protein